MGELLALGCLLGVGTMTCTFVSSYVCSTKVINILKSEYPDVWAYLGRPVPFGNSIQTARAVKKFISSPDSYVKDDAIAKLAGALRVITRIHFCAFALAITCFMLAIVVKRSSP